MYVMSDCEQFCQNNTLIDRGRWRILVYADSFDPSLLMRINEQDIQCDNILLSEPLYDPLGPS